MRDQAAGGGEAFASFEALVLGDAELQARLARHERSDAFAREAAAAAAAAGISLDAQALEKRLVQGPFPPRFGIDPVAVEPCWPAGDWLPVGAAALPGEGIVVDWAHFGEAPLDDPFFSQSATCARARPFNRLFAWRTGLGDFIDSAQIGDGPLPSGFVFHLSRCGSTLVSRMLGALPGATSVSEPVPLDLIVQCALAGGWSEAERLAAVRAMVGAYGRRARRSGGPFFLKLDAWHTLALTLLRAAFPGVPWLFLYRDPVEVLVSHAAQAGVHTVPQLMNPAFFGIEDAMRLAPIDYAARALGRIAEAAADHYDLGGGLLINYSQLPEAVAAAILPHFGIYPCAAEGAALAAAAGQDAKTPHQAFLPDGERKRAAAGAAVKEAAERHLRPVYDRLEALRTGGAT
jgi:hypothetical protein